MRGFLTGPQHAWSASHIVSLSLQLQVFYHVDQSVFLKHAVSSSQSRPHRGSVSHRPRFSFDIPLVPEAPGSFDAQSVTLVTGVVPVRAAIEEVGLEGILVSGPVALQAGLFQIGFVGVTVDGTVRVLPVVMVQVLVATITVSMQVETGFVVVQIQVVVVTGVGVGRSVGIKLGFR